MMTFLRYVAMGIAIVLLAMATCAETMYGQQTAPPSPRPTQFTLLFPRDGRVTEGWQVRMWADTKDAPKHETIWEVRDGILYGGWGIGLRTLMTGRPSQNSMELQITDPRYEFTLYRHAGNDSLTGAIYKALAPLNNILVQDADLDKETTPVKTEDGEFPSLSKRPRRGRIGFQDLSNPGEQLLFRNPRIAVLSQ